MGPGSICPLLPGAATRGTSISGWHSQAGGEHPGPLGAGQATSSELFSSSGTDLCHVPPWLPLPADQRRLGGDRLPGARRGRGTAGGLFAARSHLRSRLPHRGSGRVSLPPGSGGRGPPALTAPRKRRCRGAGPPPAERYQLIFRWRQRLPISVHVYGFLRTRWCFTLFSGRLTRSRTISSSSKISLGE